MGPDTIAPPLLYRDALVLVIDKPAGLPVHPGRGGGPTLVDHLDAFRFGLPARPEAAHRLDRDTSGCLVLGRHRQALQRLGKLFASGRVEKRYWAIVEGGPGGETGEIDLPLAPRSPDPATWHVKVDPAGKPSLTRWRVLGRTEDAAWLELEPVTGRTHQLRAHCAAAGWPIRGDRHYGRGGGPLMLHARSLVLPLYPSRPPIAVAAAAPEHMRAALADCGYRDG